MITSKKLHKIYQILRNNLIYEYMGVYASNGGLRPIVFVKYFCRFHPLFITETYLHFNAQHHETECIDMTITKYSKLKV